MTCEISEFDRRGMNERVLVLGAHGFIGRRIVAQLSQDSGTAIIAAGRRAVAGSSSGNVETLALDAADARALQAALGGITGVVNCVAGSPDNIVACAKALFAAAARHKPPPRIVHLSSLAVYGSITGLVDETVAPLGDLGEYSAAKLAAEKLASTCESVLLRPGIVYGAGSPWWSDRIARLLCARRLGDLREGGEGLCNLVYVDDVAAAAVLALRTPKALGGTFNLGSPQIPTWNDYFARYAKALGALPVRRISPRRLALELYGFAPALKVLDIACGFGPLRRLHPPPPIRPWLTTLCRHRIGMAVTRAEMDLGMRWTDLDEGLKATAAWFLAGGRA
jgi:nucleoside-diphosphate-sugar epimerase